MARRSADDPADRRFMDAAIAEARQSLSEGGVPIGAVVVIDDDIAGAGRNRRIQTGSPVRHAETEALDAVGFLPESLKRATVYTTLVPCYMCAGAMVHYRIPRVVTGERRTVAGGEELLHAHGITVLDLDLDECRQLMATFIRNNPKLWHEHDASRTD